MDKKLEAKIIRRKRATKINMALLKKDVEANQDSYQYKRANKFLVSQRCIGYALKKLGVTYKKTLVHPKANEEKRTMFQNRIAKYKEEGCSIFCIDESGFAHDMTKT